MLTENQITWIFKKVHAIAMEYCTKDSLNNDDWLSFSDRLNALNKSARGNILTQKLLIAVMETLEEEEKMRSGVDE